MKRIKIIIGIFVSLIFLLSLNGAFATTEYLNSCKGTSWNNDTNYIINFTQVISGDTTNSLSQEHCLYFGNGEILNNITITGQEPISIETSSDLDSFITLDGGLSSGNKVQINNSIIENIELIGTEELESFITIYRSSSGSTKIDNSQINNISIENELKYFAYLVGVSGSNAEIINSDIDLIYLPNHYNNFVNDGGGGESRNRIALSNLSRIYTPSTASLGANKNNDFTNVIFYFENGLDVGSQQVTYDSSIIKSYPHSDGGSGFAISDIYANMTNARMYYDLFEFRFIQDNENAGNYRGTNNIIIPVKQESLSTTNEFLLGSDSNNILDSSNVNYNFTNVFGMHIARTTKLDCSIISSKKCFFEDYNYNGFPNNKMIGFIRVSKNSEIENIKFEKKENNGANIISNLVDTTYDNITIRDSEFIKRDLVDKTNLSSNGTHFIKLNSNNLDITNNTFKTESSNNEYEVLSIEATNSNTNKVHNNIFNSTLGNINSEIFTGSCDTLFYNNYIDAHYQINLRNDCNNLNVSPLIPYEHTNGNIYYYRLGNYYTNNSGCTDSDSNGICDSSYQSGNITDDYPLSEYPFDYENNIPFAESTVTDTTLNIELVQPLDSSNFNLSSPSSAINITFYQDSEFNDMNCDYILNSNALSGGTLTNVENNVNKSILVNDLDEGTNTIKIECFNDFVFNSSNTNTITINYDEEQTNNNVIGNVENPFVIEGGDIIDTNDPTGTSNNVIDFMGNVGAMLFNIFIPMVFFIVIILALLFMIIIVS